MDNSCECQGDDGLNVHAYYFTVVQVRNATAVVTPCVTATVASYSVYNASSQLFIFTSPINATVGDMVCVSNTPSLTIRNLMVANNRARGVLLETRNIQITQSLFNATSAPAVLFEPSLYWYESPGAQNVLLSQNVYINCNQGLYQTGGVISLLPYPVQTIPVISNIQVSSSTFISVGYNASVLQVTNGANVVLTGNYIAMNTTTAPVRICNSQNVSASNNNLLNNPTSQFFVYDTPAPCNTGLSSGINVPDQHLMYHFHHRST